MKKIAFILLTMAFLSGCSNAPATPSSDASTNTNSSSTTASQGISPVDGSKVSNTEDIAPEGADNFQPVIQPSSEIKLTEDQKIRGEAVSKLDLAGCDQLKEANAKQGCQLEIISQKLMTDPEYCKTLTNSEHQNVCKGLSLTIFPPKS